MEKTIRTQFVKEFLEAVLTLESVDECMDFFEDVCTVKEVQSIASDIAHRRMIFLCEQEAQVCILQHLRILLRLKHQIDPECLKTIGGSAFARSGSVSVLGNCHTCRCSYNRRGC